MTGPPDTVVDARGHHCPVPTLRLRRALEAAAVGHIIALYVDDPMAAIDVPHFVEQIGANLLDRHIDGQTMVFRVRKSI